MTSLIFGTYQFIESRVILQKLVSNNLKENSVKGHLNFKHSYRWLFFLLFSIAFCAIISFRVIPNVDSPNDTGRYVYYLKQYCQGTIDHQNIDQENSFTIFYFINSFSCLLDSDIFFLFEVAFFLPLTFLLFSKWRDGTLFLSLSALFSVFGLELMTNAMRQCFATFLFLGAVSLIKTHRLFGLCLLLTSNFAHSSTISYTPLFFILLLKENIPKRFYKNLFYLISILIIVVTLIFFSELTELFSAAEKANEFYSAIYSEDASLTFLCFLITPILIVYTTRNIIDCCQISNDENIALIYSLVLIIASFILFPAITYRFIIFSTSIQIFLASCAEKQSEKSSILILFFSIAHLAFMQINSGAYTIFWLG